MKRWYPRLMTRLELDLLNKTGSIELPKNVIKLDRTRRKNNKGNYRSLVPTQLHD